MGKKQMRTREPLRLAETVCGWHNPPGARKCEEIPYALIRLMTSHYQWDINAQTKHAPPRLGAPLRYGPRHYMSAYAASLRSVAPGSIFFFYATPGFRGFAAPPPGYHMSPLICCRGSNLGFAIARKLFFNFRFIAQSAERTIDLSPP